MSISNTLGGILKKSHFFLASSLLIFGELCAQVNAGDVIVFRNGTAEIVLQDHLNHSFYWWPKTLISYPIEFEDEQVNLNQLSLEFLGQSIPFQFSELKHHAGQLKKARIHFFTDLPSGSVQRFYLKKGKPKSNSTIEAKFSGDTLLVVNTDRFSLSIPTQKFPNQNRFPGPYTAVDAQGISMGTSFFSGTEEVTSLRMAIVEQGPLFHEYQLDYTFANGGRYQANLKIMAEMDFFELREKMEGLQPGQAEWHMQWTGFEPTHRQAPNHPYQPTPNEEPGFNRYNWEPIDQHLMDHPQGLVASDVPGKLWMELGIYEPWHSDKNLTSALFWDEKKNISRGVFINYLEEWNDHEYAIWDSSPTLNVTFYYHEGLLTWHYPLVTGTRATAVSVYGHQKDIDYMSHLEEIHQKQKHPLGFNYQANMSTLSWNMFLQNRYGTIHLDKVKDWQLTYQDSLIQPTVFEQGRLKTVKDLYEHFLYHSYVLELPVGGTRQNSGFSPVPARLFHDDWIDAFNRLWPEMNQEELKRFTAMYLFHAYVSADEEHMPMKYMLSGHPNFLADIKSVPAMIAFLFPEHPEAENWSNLFEKYLELNTRYHTRPPVRAWNAEGGRWTENLGTYVWAFMRPSIRAAWLLKEHRSGKNRLVSPYLGQMGNWILNALSAPYNGERLGFYREEEGKEIDYHYWGVVQKDDGPRRVHPPQGAHSARRRAARSLWLLGDFFQNYDPLLAEHLMHVSRPTDQDFERLDSSKDPFNLMYPEKSYNTGTPPDLNSIKLTGYGNILRAGMKSLEELSLHLIQIDEGPNYRWGIAGDGGNGMIYYYAGGKSFSHNGMEDVGDRRVQDTDFTTNFGVFRDGTFKSIGRNTLHRPMYNLGNMQFAELVSDSISGPSWPEYKSRSVMLVGTDYFITYDDVFGNGISGRYSWFTHPEEAMPTIEVLKTGGVRNDRDKLRTTKIETRESKGLWLDGSGDFLVLVSHKENFRSIGTDFGVKITTPEGNLDYIFRNDELIQFEGEGLIFKGTAGLARNLKVGGHELALFHGSLIGNELIHLSTDQNKAGISAIIQSDNEINGQFYAYEATKVTISWPNGRPSKLKFYLNGKKVQPEDQEGSWRVKFNGGHHHWQISAGEPVPMRPIIKGYVNQGEKAMLIIGDEIPASKYIIEVSNDVGESWKEAGSTRKQAFTLNGYQPDSKIHVRVRAQNKDKLSVYSIVYPVYFRNREPDYPDGLKLSLEGSKVSLNWGEVLGCQLYHLYRRKQGDREYQLIFKGAKRQFNEILPSNDIYEYTVTAINGNGESKMAFPVNTNSDSWLNWNPRPWERFRRIHGARTFEKDLDDEELYYPK